MVLLEIENEGKLRTGRPRRDLGRGRGGGGGGGGGPAIFWFFSQVGSFPQFFLIDLGQPRERRRSAATRRSCRHGTAGAENQRILKNNQRKSNVSGWQARRRGRKRGSPNKTTAQRIAEVAASGVTPLDHMLAVLRDPLQPVERRDWAAEKAAPYCHPKLAQKDVNITQTFDVADRIIARWKENLGETGGGRAARDCGGAITERCGGITSTGCTGPLAALPSNRNALARLRCSP